MRYKVRLYYKSPYTIKGIELTDNNERCLVQTNHSNFILETKKVRLISCTISLLTLVYSMKANK